MTGAYDLQLVALSLVVAIIASYTALELAGHVSQKQGKSSWTWLVGGAISMGTGIWSMHFIGMLAFHLPVRLAYDASITMLSMGIAVLVSGLALFVVRRSVLTWRNITAGATLMGFGICAMHYTGMYAMRMSPPIEYHPPLFIASVIIAIVASLAALWIAFQLRHKHFGVAVLAKLGSAIVMGLAITGMHYTGMAAAEFAPGSICLAVDSTDGMQSDALAMIIGITTIGILAITLAISALDARFVTERKRGEEELLRFGAAMDATADAIYLVDRASMCFVYVNDAACRMQNQTREKLLALGPGEVLSTSRAELERTYDSVIASGGDAKPTEMLRQRKDGSEVWVELRCQAQRSGDRWMIVTLEHDVTERKGAKDKIVHLNRVYAMLSGINTLIVRVRDRDELFREACRIAVEHGQLQIAWIGMVDRSAMKIVPVASAGAAPGFFEEIGARFSLVDGSPVGHSPPAMAIREKQAVVVNDVQTDPRIRNKIAHANRGIRSVVSLPLLIANEPVAVFVLHAAEAGYFDEAEMKLLRELADDISFALEHIDKEQKVRRLTRVHAVLTGINAAIVRIRDREELFGEACRIAAQSGQFPLALVAVADPRDQVVKAVAWAGDERGFVQLTRPTVDAKGQDKPGLGAQAMEKCTPVVCNDIEAGGRTMRYAKEALERGYRSAAAVPLLVEGAPVGALVLYAAETGFFDDEEKNLLVELAGNISFALEHIDKQEKVRRLTRVHAMLSGINTLIVRVQDRDELFREACRMAVEAGAFRMAWIGVVDNEAGIVKPIASAGDVRDFFDIAPLAVTETKPDGHGLAGRAVRDMEPMISNDVQNDPQRLTKTEMKERGINSLAVIPLIVGGEAIGVFGLYSVDVGFFDDEEMRLLQELAGNISFAMDHIGKQNRLDYLAYYDVLTGLANRSLFLERVAQHMRSAASGGHKLALFLLDLERFKSINDSLGRTTGDELLRQVADWLTRNIGDANLVARVGADHFAVVLPEVKRGGNLARLVERTNEAFMEHPFRLNDAMFRIAFKTGGALFPDDGLTADVLFKHAEAALKKAKASGDRYLFYTEKMTATVAGKLTLENQLRQALDKEEFVLHYQPKVSLASGKLTGAEALIRWNDPQTGLVPPGHFIPVLEETGLIHEVGRWALRKTIEDYLRWRAAGLAAVRIAVNVSPLQLRNRGFIAEIEQEIGIHPHAAAGLELELTESLIMEDVKHNIASLQAIRALGVTIAIDDFGTGFSSLSYLAKLPVDTLKIDRSFVNDMTAAPQGLALVSTIITLAHSLKLKVVAEGVETEEQSRLLRSLSCDEMQGYLFSKPVPREIFEARFLAPVIVREVLQGA